MLDQVAIRWRFRIIGIDVHSRNFIKRFVNLLMIGFSSEFWRGLLAARVLASSMPYALRVLFDLPLTWQTFNWLP